MPFEDGQNTENIRNLYPFTHLLICLVYLLCTGDSVIDQKYTE